MSTHHTTAPNSTPKISPPSPSPFPVTSLPSELRLKIYTIYLSSPTPLLITPTNALNSNLHTKSPLHLSSPFFTHDIPPSYFYKNVTFLFTSGEDMRNFIRTGERSDPNHRNQNPRRNVKRIIIREKEGAQRVVGRDYVHLMNSCFSNLEDVAFVYDSLAVADFANWWMALVDAVREGRGGWEGEKRGGLVLRCCFDGERKKGEGVRFVC